MGQLFQLIGRGFNAVFLFFLRVFLYLKKNILILISLLILGLAIGYGLSKIISKKLKTVVIVKPQMESKNYLYDVVEEIESNIQAEDTLFFKSIGLDKVDFNGLEITIGRVEEEISSESDIKYLELLQSFDNIEAISDIIRAELQNKSSFNHRIIFFYKNAESGKNFANKVMAYINKNQYFDGLIEIYRSNANSRIEQNKVLLEQVDEIITNYAAKMVKDESQLGSDRILLDNQETVNITGLFSLKNDLIRDIELKKLELEERSQPIKIINFGKSQEIHKLFFGKKIILLPLIFLGSFFLVSFLGYLNRKSASL